LTQAMKILVDQGVALNKHRARLYHPTTNTNQSVQLAQKLKLNLGRDFATTHTGHIMGNLHQFSMIHHRHKNEESYGWQNRVWDSTLMPPRPTEKQ